MLGKKNKNFSSFWWTLKSIPTKPKSKLSSTTFKVNKEVISNKERIPRGFGGFFSSIATTLLNLYTLQMTLYGINQRTFWCEQPKHVSFTRSHCQKSVNAWKNFDIRNHTQSRNFHQIHLKMLPTKFQNQWLSSSINLYSQLQFQTSENIKSYTTLRIRFKIWL